MPKEEQYDNRSRALKKIQEKFYKFNPLNSPLGARIDDKGGVWVRMTIREDNKEHLLIKPNGDLVKNIDSLPITIRRALGIDSETLIQNNNRLIDELNEANERE